MKIFVISSWKTTSVSQVITSLHAMVILRHKMHSTCPMIRCLVRNMGLLKKIKRGHVSRISHSHALCLNTSPPLCRVYASVNRVSIGSDYGLSLVRRQAIIQTHTGVLPMGLIGTKFSEKFNQDPRKCIWKNDREMAAILSRGGWVDLATMAMLGHQVSGDQVIWWHKVIC